MQELSFKRVGVIEKRLLGLVLLSAALTLLVLNREVQYILTAKSFLTQWGLFEILKMKYLNSIPELHTMINVFYDHLLTILLVNIPMQSHTFLTETAGLAITLLGIGRRNRTTLACGATILALTLAISSLLW